MPADRLAAVLISHAHIDHVGSLPTIVAGVGGRHGRRGAGVDDAPTRRLAEIMLETPRGSNERARSGSACWPLGETDYAAGFDARGVYPPGRRGAPRAGPSGAPRRQVPHRGHEPARAVPPGVARARELRDPPTDEQSGATLLYTGDLGPVSDPQATLPHWGFDELEPADVVIMESTYGVARRGLAEGRRSLHGRERALQTAGRLRREDRRRGRVPPAALLQPRERPGARHADR